MNCVHQKWSIYDDRLNDRGGRMLPRRPLIDELLLKCGDE